MRINESVFRKILREEARRVLNEAEGTPPAAAPAGAAATPAGGAGAVSGPPTAAASGTLTAAKASHDAAYKAADEQSDRLIAAIDKKGTAAQPLMASLGLPVKAGIGKLRDPNSPAYTNFEAAVRRVSQLGTAQGAAGPVLVMFAALVTGKTVQSWQEAVKLLGYNESLSTASARVDNPSKITDGSPGLKALIALATEMGGQFNTAVTPLLGTSQGVKAAAAGAVPKAAPAGAPAPGTAPAAAGPAKDWSGYNSKVKNGAAVQQAWSDFSTSAANTQGFNASFGSFVKYYNALIKQMNVKYLSPDQMIKHLKDKVAAAAAGAGLAPVTIAPDTAVPSLGGGRLQGLEANKAALDADTAASYRALGSTPPR